MLAPKEPQETVLQYGIPVKTKMVRCLPPLLSPRKLIAVEPSQFRSEPHYGSKPLETPTDTKMFKVPNIYGS